MELFLYRPVVLDQRVIEIGVDLNLAVSRDEINFTEEPVSKMKATFHIIDSHLYSRD